MYISPSRAQALVNSRKNQAVEDLRRISTAHPVVKAICLRISELPASRSYPNAPLSKNSLLGRPKCERGAHFCMAKRTPIKDSDLRISKM